MHAFFSMSPSAEDVEVYTMIGMLEEAPLLSAFEGRGLRPASANCDSSYSTSINSKSSLYFIFKEVAIPRLRSYNNKNLMSIFSPV